MLFLPEAVKTFDRRVSVSAILPFASGAPLKLRSSRSFGKSFAGLNQGCDVHAVINAAAGLGHSVPSQARSTSVSLLPNIASNWHPKSQFSREKLARSRRARKIPPTFPTAQFARGRFGCMASATKNRRSAHMIWITGSPNGWADGTVHVRAFVGYPCHHKDPSQGARNATYCGVARNDRHIRGRRGVFLE